MPSDDDHRHPEPLRLTEVHLMLANRELDEGELALARDTLRVEAGVEVVAHETRQAPGKPETARTMLFVVPVCPRTVHL
jgi:hypothetical protein